MEKQQIYSKENIKKVLKAKGIELDARPFYVNLIGIRRVEERINYFDDTLVTIIYKPNGAEIKYYNITTEAGTYYLKNPLNKKGTAILKEGFHKDCWALGKHKGTDALVQINPLIVYRDNDKDGEYDTVGVPEEEGLYGINLHGRYFDGKSLDANTLVNKWSAGCQVFEKNDDLVKVLDDCQISVRVGNRNLFSYILLEHKDFLSL